MMNENIRKVRKSIEERKKQRKLPVTSKRSSSDRVLAALPEEEEKHGYFPLFPPAHSKQRKKSKDAYITRLILKGVLALALFLSTALIMETDRPMFSQAKQWTRSGLSQEFPFARVNQWYQEAFGAPLAFENNRVIDSTEMALPASGRVIESFQAHGSGILIAPEETTNVSVFKSGVIIFAGNDRQTGKTVVVQHADHSLSTYGHLSSIDVHVYQSVQANEQLGVFDPAESMENLYFAIEKNNEPINPVQVMQVDERP